MGKNTASSKDFSYYIPGTWSSHPVALKKQRFWLILACLLPIVAFIVIGGFFLTDFDSWIALFKNAPTWLLVIGSVLSFTLGAFITVLMLHVVGRTLPSRKNNLNGRDEIPFPIGVFVAFAFFWIIPQLLTLVRHYIWDGPYFGVIQFALNLMCFLPILGILFWVALAKTDNERGDGVKKHFKTLAIFGFFFLGLAFLSLVTDLQLVLAKWLPSISGIDKAVFRIISFATLFPLGMVFFYLWRLVWHITNNAATRKQDKAVAVTSASAAEDGGVISERKPPSFAENLRNRLPEGVTMPDEIRLRDVSDSECSSDYAPNTPEAKSWALLMDGKLPTSDQFKFFTQYKDVLGASVEAALKNDDNHITARADMLISGVEGSGRTEALCVVALYSALVRGQRVLFVVPSESHATTVCNKINKRIKSLLLDSYLSCGRLCKREVRFWTSEENPVTVPTIQIATPSEVEDAFFSLESTQGVEILEALKCVLPTVGVVLVDDFSEYDLPVRAHLAFILHKLKLINACSFNLSQFVVSVGELSYSGLDDLGLKIFGPDGYAVDDRNQTRNAVKLHPRRCESYWYGELKIEEGKDFNIACREIIEACISDDRKVLFYRKGFPAGDLVQWFESSHDKSRVKFIYDIDELEGIGESPDWALYLSLTGGDAGSALRLNLAKGDSKTDAVFLRIYSANEAVQVKREEAVLLPDQTAVPLRMSHLISVLPYIPSMRPVAANVWRDFGVSPDNPCVRKARVHDSTWDYSNVRWEYDSLRDAIDSQYSERTIWPYIVLINAYGGVKNCSHDHTLTTLPDSLLNIWRDDDLACKGIQQLMLAEVDDRECQGHAKSRVKWFDASNGQSAPLGESDISHWEQMVLVANGRTYVLGNIQGANDLDSNRYAMSIKTGRRDGADRDFVLLIREFSWHVSPDKLYVPTVGSNDQIATCTIERTSGVNFRIKGRVCGKMSLLGEYMRTGLFDYSYDAYLSCIVLMPTLESVDGDNGADAVRECLSGNWSTSGKDGFSPCLTYALTIALQERIAGFSYFASVPTFYVEGRQRSVGKVLVWIVEPVSSGRVVYPLIAGCMEKDSSFREGVFRRAKEVLTTCKSVRDFRVLSRTPYSQEVLSEKDRNDALDVIEMLISNEAKEKEERRRQENRIKEEERRRKEKEDDSKRETSRSRDNYSAQEKQFEDIVVRSLLEFKQEIDVLVFAKDYQWSKHKISDLYDDVLWNHPELFHVSKYGGKYHWTIDEHGEYSSFVIRDIYYDTAISNQADYERGKARLDAVAREAIDRARAFERDPALMIKEIHDFIVRVCSYDHEAADAPDTEDTTRARTAYSVLVRHKAVCEGYVMAFRYLLDKLNIRSEEVISHKMVHCWNYVLLRGHWYHVDVTWDDRDRKGRTDEAIHKYFLLSDEAIRDRGHSNWSVRGLPPATDKWYDNFDWGDGQAEKRGSDDSSIQEEKAQSPVEKYPRHVAFNKINCGCTLSCRGNIVLRLFLVDDAKSSWGESDEAEFLRAVASASARLVDGAKSEGVDAKITIAHAQKRISIEAIPNSDDEKTWIQEIFGTNYSSEIVADQNRFRKALGCDESPIVFAFNKDFRSCALTASKRNSTPGSRNQQEWSMVAFRDGDFENTLIHELLHQFGAIDLYYPANLKAAAQKFLPESIMCSGEVIDDLTKYLVGWKSTLPADSDAWKFLERTKMITADDVSKALSQEWKKKWHGG